MSLYRFTTILAAMFCFGTHPSVVAAEPSKNTSTEAKFVTIAGDMDVRTPGKLTWTPDLTLLSALASAGGTGGFARSATIIRGKQKLIFRIKKLHKQPETDPRLQPGDIVEVGD